MPIGAAAFRAHLNAENRVRLEGVRVLEAALRAVDPELRSLENVNDPETYEAAVRRYRTRPPAS